MFGISLYRVTTNDSFLEAVENAANDPLKLLDLSIAKWQFITDNSGEDEDDGLECGGGFTCALCRTYAGNNCEGCPVATEAAPHCEGTPYDDYDYQHNKANAQRELDFLVGLRNKLALHRSHHLHKK